MFKTVITQGAVKTPLPTLYNNIIYITIYTLNQTLSEYMDRGYVVTCL